MNIELQSKLFKLRSILNRISDVSYAYKTLYNKYRINEITDEQAHQLVKAYGDLINQVKNSIQNIEYEISSDSH
jgi:hypothetical protein